MEQQVKSGDMVLATDNTEKKKSVPGWNAVKIRQKLLR
jgi:hypothetical protein